MARGLRSVLRQEARRAEREDRRQQARSRRATVRRHTAVPRNAGTRAAGPDLVREHRGVHGGEAGTPVAGRIRAWSRRVGSGHPVEHDLRVRRAQGGDSLCQRGAESERRCAGPRGAGGADGITPGRQGPQDRPDVDEDDGRSRVEGAPARSVRLVLHQHPGKPRRRGARRSGVVQDEGGEQEVGARPHPAAGALSDALRRPAPRRAHQLLPAAGRQQGGLGTTSIWSGGSTTRCS